VQLLVIYYLFILFMYLFIHSRLYQSNIVVKNAAKIIENIRCGDMNKVDELLVTSKGTIADLLAVVQQNQALRNGRLRMAIEKVVEAELLVIFFRTGKLALFNMVQPCSDEEYIIASLSMAQELSRYCKQRACEVIRLFASAHICHCNTLTHINIIFICRVMLVLCHFATRT
jgi:hypothetical protein